MKKILFVLTSHNQLGTTGRNTGYYLAELTHPYFIFQEAGFEMDIASIKGGKAPMSDSSLVTKDVINDRFLENPDLVQQIENTIPLSSINSSNYDAVFFVGGHGTMWDFPYNKNLADIAVEVYEAGGIIAAVCHGPSALVGIRLNNGSYLVKDKEVTAFSNAEEDSINATSIMPFSLETALTQAGAKFSKADVWCAHTVVSERLVTGQNPASAQGVAIETKKLFQLVK